MKLLLVIAGFFLGASAVSAEELTVFAKEGLILRDRPSKTGKKLRVIKFGTRLEIAEASDSEWHIASGIKAKFVKTTYQGTEGYVFKGFLSKLTVPSKKFSTVEEYLELVYGPAKTQKLVPDPEAAETRKSRKTFKEGIIMTSTTYLGGAYSEIVMPGTLEIREVYLLFSAVDSDFRKVPFNSSNPNEFTCDVFLEDPIGKTGPVISLSIKRTGGKLTITSGGQT